MNSTLSCLRTSDVRGHLLQSRKTRHRGTASAVSAHDTSKSVIRRFRSGPLQAWPHLSELQLLSQAALMRLPQRYHRKNDQTCERNSLSWKDYVNPYPTAFPYGNGMVLQFYQQQESNTTKTVHKVINKGLKTYV